MKHLSACCACLFLMACEPAAPIHKNQRLIGPEYFKISELALTPDQCRQLCAEDKTDCKGWNWEAPSGAEPMATCSLLEQVDEARDDPCCVSGKAGFVYKPDSRAFGKTKRLPEETVKTKRGE